MLAELKFVQGAVAKKDLMPALTHFRIEDGHVRSFNGTLAISSPIAFDIDCTPKGIPFVKAIQNCKETVTMKLTPTGKLSIKSGKFKALIPCVDTETPHVIPEGKMHEVDGDELLRAFKLLLPLVGDDASKPWSNGLLLKGQSAFATNNIVIAQYWLGVEFPVVCNVPAMAVKEVLRVKEPPIGIQIAENSITFHYKDKRWIRTALYDTAWPEVERILDVPSNAVPIDEKLYEALDIIKPFTDDMNRVYIKGGKVMTHLDDSDGASYEVEGLVIDGVFSRDMLVLLKGVATTADFDLYPKPSQFFGPKIRGAIVGMRV